MIDFRRLFTRGRLEPRIGTDFAGLNDAAAAEASCLSENAVKVKSEPSGTVRGGYGTPPRIFLLGASPALTSAGVLPTSTPNTPVSSLSADMLKRTGGNTGNQIIAFGLLQALDYTTVSWDYTIGPQRVNEEFDVLVIAAANFLHTGFDFTGMADFISATNLPVTMVGVGAQSNDYSTKIELQPGTERLMRVVSDRSTLIGARGPFTAEVLSAMGIKNVQVTGCPSYYMNCKPELNVKKLGLGAKPRLVMNSSRDVARHAFDREQMLTLVCHLLKIAIERSADFVAQSEIEEIMIADAKDPKEVELNLNSLLKTFPFYANVGTHETLLAWYSKHARVFWDVPNWYETMKQYDFVFGNRFHGNLIALQAGTPACVICHDTRTSEMCEFLGIPFVPLREADSITVDELYDRVQPDAILSRYRNLYPKYKSFLYKNGLPAKLA